MYTLTESVHPCNACVVLRCKTRGQPEHQLDDAIEAISMALLLSLCIPRRLIGQAGITKTNGLAPNRLVVRAGRV
jgi:hypothetical protein